MGFWQDKRVLVTGHTGFKGSWLALWLERAGAQVTGFALVPETDPSLFELARVGAGIASIEGDVRKGQLVAEVVAEHRPEVVIHMAAQAIVRTSYDDPAATYATNVMGTVNVLEAVRRHPGARAVVVVTSDKCYDNREIDRGYREDEPLGGRDPYSSSKGCAELVARAYRDSFLAEAGVAVASARAGNVIGGGDWAKDRLVPDLVRSMTAGEPLFVRYPKAVRPWLHVLEPVSGYLLLARRLWEDGPRFAEAWNFAPREDAELVSVGELVARLARHWDDSVAVELHPGPHPHEHTLLRLDPSKARERLGWHARLSVAETLEWVAEWYRGHRDGADARELTEDQIGRYQELVSRA